MKRKLLFLCLFTALGVATKAQDLEDGLIFYLPCDDSSSMDAINGIEGLFNGDMVTDTGFNGQKMGSFYYDGVDDYFEFLDTEIEGLPAGDAERSFAVWIKTTATGKNMDIISYGTQDNGQHMHLAYRSGESIIRNGYWYADYDYAANLSDGAWHHIVATLGEVSAAYIDGEFIEEKEIITSTVLNTVLNGVLRIGRRNTAETEFYEGSIDEIRIYDRVLSEDDVYDLYNYDPADTPDNLNDMRQDVFRIYPTVVSSNLNITSNGQEYISVRIYNNLGTLVLSTDFSGNSSILDVSKLSSGLYYIRLDGNEKTITGRFIKK